ncbi:MAG: leucine-rich repeat domain-containing protein [Christensenellales bacterium]
MRKIKIFFVVFAVLSLTVILSACNSDTVKYDFKDGDFGYTVNEDGESVTLSVWLERTNGNVVIPSTATNGGKTYKVTTIGTGVFAATYGKLKASDCFGNYSDVSNNDLLSVTFAPNSNVTTIEGRAFEKCKNIETVVLPETVKTISGFAFYKCEKLVSVTIDKNVTEIGDDCFSGCTSLETVTLKHTDSKNLPEIGDRAFKWYDSSVKSFMGSNDPYKVLDCTFKVENEAMLAAFKGTGTSSNLNLRYWHDYADKFSL